MSLHRPKYGKKIFPFGMEFRPIKPLISGWYGPYTSITTKHPNGRSQQIEICQQIAKELIAPGYPDCRYCPNFVVEATISFSSIQHGTGNMLTTRIFSKFYA